MFGRYSSFFGLPTSYQKQKGGELIRNQQDPVLFPGYSSKASRKPNGSHPFRGSSGQGAAIESPGGVQGGVLRLVAEVTGEVEVFVVMDLGPLPRHGFFAKVTAQGNSLKGKHTLSDFEHL